MLLLEEELRKIDDAYLRIFVSEGNYETPGLKETLETAIPIRCSMYFSEFLKSYKDNILFLRYETLSRFLGKERIFQLLLSNMADCDKEYCVYVFAQKSELENLRNTLDRMYAYEKERMDKLYKKWTDDG